MACTVHFLILCQTLSLLIRVFTSTQTPPDVSVMLHEVVSLFDQIVSLASINSPEELLSYREDVAIDCLYNESLSVILDTEVRGNSVYLNEWRRDKEGPGRKTENSYEDKFTKFVQALNLTHVLIIADSQTHNLKAAEYLLEKYPDVYSKKAVVPRTAGKDFCEQFVGRAVKPRGINFMTLFTDEVTAFNLLAAFESHKINRAGYVYILSEEAGFYRYISLPRVSLHQFGPLIVAEPAAESNSYLSFQRNRLTETIDAISRLSPGIPPIHNPIFSLYSIIDSNLSFVTSDPFAVFPSYKILLPGYTNEIPQHFTAEITASVNYEITDPNSSILPVSRVLMRGFELAFDEVNKRTDLIPDYIVRNTSVKYTGVIFDYNVTKGRVMRDKGSVGLIHMPPPFSQSIIGIFNVFKDLNISVPVTAGSSSSTLSDPIKYPLFIRTRVSNEYVLMILCKMIAYFGWTHVAVLYQEDFEDCTNSYEIFLRLAPMFHFNITNSENNRRTNSVANATTTARLHVSIQEIIDSDTRVILFLTTYAQIILDQMYDKGIREEYEILFMYGLSDAIFIEQKSYKRRIVNKGALMFFPKLFVGEVGQSVQKRLIDIDKEWYIANSCIYYDAAMLYFHATDFLLEHGKDYEDPYQIVNSMRNTRFIGCSGLIKIQPDSNDRDSAEISVTNFRYDSSSDKYEIRIIGSYNPYISEPFQFKKEDIQWPTGESTFTDYKPKFRYCSYLESKVQIVPLGKAIAGAVAIALTLFASVCSLVVYSKGKYLPWRLMNQSYHISVDDVICFLKAIIEFFALASVAPDISNIRRAIESEGGSVSLIFDEMTHSERNTYWDWLWFAIAVSGWWLLMSILKFFKLEEKLCLGTIAKFNEFLSQFALSVLFLPIVATFLGVFMCSKGLSESISDSFMDKDCETRCWTGSHLAYAVVSGISLFTYTFLSLIFRLYIENRQYGLHIKSNPMATLIKVPSQVLFAVWFVVLQEEFPYIHAYLFISGLVLYLIVMVFLQEYNYPRLNLWTAIIQISVLLLAISAYLSRELSPTEVLWLILGLISAYCLLIAIGVVVQSIAPKFASRLIRSKGINIKYLLEFAFTRGERASKALHNHYASNNIRMESDQPFALYI